MSNDKLKLLVYFIVFCNLLFLALMIIIAKKGMLCIEDPLNFGIERVAKASNTSIYCTCYSGDGRSFDFSSNSIAVKTSSGFSEDINLSLNS